MLPTFTENLKTFGHVVLELQRFTICHFDLKTVYLQFWVARRGLSDLEDGVMLVIHSLFWMGRWDMSDMANGLLIVIIQFMSYG